MNAYTDTHTHTHSSHRVRLRLRLDVIDSVFVFMCNIVSFGLNDWCVCTHTHTSGHFPRATIPSQCYILSVIVGGGSSDDWLTKIHLSTFRQFSKIKFNIANDTHTDNSMPCQPYDVCKICIPMLFIWTWFNSISFLSFWPVFLSPILHVHITFIYGRTVFVCACVFFFLPWRTKFIASHRLHIHAVHNKCNLYTDL